MKTLLFSALCFAFAGCASTSSSGGGGWVVGNGMTDSQTGSQGMGHLGKDRVEDDCACVGEKDCECAPTKAPVKKKKKKALVPQT